MGCQVLRFLQSELQEPLQRQKRLDYRLRYQVVVLLTIEHGFRETR
jgi:hypothetical protein